MPARALPESIDEGWISEITAGAARYGFHGTLKPPFRLSEGRNVDSLLRAAEAFAVDREAFRLPPLEVREIGSFLALVPGAACRPLTDLANDCVRHFDPFRAPSTADELARHRAAGLTARQKRMLAKWGYPYVFGELRFHLTLTGLLPDSDRHKARKTLERLWWPHAGHSFKVDSICVFEQPGAGADFRLLRRLPFGAPSRTTAAAR